MIERLYSWDLKLLFTLNHHHSPLWDWLMWQFSGNFIWLPLYFFVIYMIIKKFGKKGLWLILLAIVAVGVADFSSVHLFKETIRRLRPCHDPSLVNQIVLVNGYCGGLYGFLSSHASNTFSLAMFTSLLLRKRYFTLIIFAWAILVSISRVYLGVHYPSDILAGATWGMIIGYIFYLIAKPLIINKNGKS